MYPLEHIAPHKDAGTRQPHLYGGKPWTHITDNAVHNSLTNSRESERGKMTC